MIPAVTTDNKNITEQIALIHHATTEQSHTVHSTTRLITAEIVAEIRIFVFVFMCQSSEFTLYFSINARTSRLAFFSPSIWAATYELSNSCFGSGLFAHISKLSIHCFVFRSFIFLFVSKKNGTGWLCKYYILALATARRRAALVVKFGVS